MSMEMDHPLSLELFSLQSSSQRFQAEAHASSVKLQRYALDSSQFASKLSALETANATLRDELAVLRAPPVSVPSPHSGELTLALRRSSDQIDLVQQTLLARTQEAQGLQSKLSRAVWDAEQAWEEADVQRKEKEDALQRESEVSRALRASQEECAMSDRVVNEYAALVRAMDVGKPQSHPTQQLDSLLEGKAGLSKLVAEFSKSITLLETKLADVYSELARCEATLVAERKGADDDRALLAEALVELDRCRVDDNSASRIVSRYMKFSQSTTDSLQRAIEAQVARHTATVQSLSTQNATLAAQLAGSQAQTEVLRVALDELGADAARETFARRREVALRLEIIGREERFKEQLTRLLTQLAENDSTLAEEAEQLLVSAGGGMDGSLGRVIAAEHAVASLRGELREETERRIGAERKVAELEVEREEVWLEREAEDLEEAELLGPPSPPREQGPVIVKIQEATPTEPSFPAIQEAVPTGGRPETPTALPQPITVLDESLDLVGDPAAGFEDSRPETPKPSALVFKTTAIPAKQEEAEHGTPQVLVVIPQTLHQPSPRTPRDTSFVLEAVVAEDVISPSPSPPAAASSGFMLLDSEETTTLVVSGAITPTTTTTQLSPLNSDEPLPTLSFPTATAPSLHSPPAVDIANSPLPVTDDQTAALLDELNKVKDRYDELQRAFRSCHLALQELKTSLASSTSPNSSILKTAVERLSDFNEDARVELEIRAADETLAARGYSTVLTLSPVEEKAEAERDVRAFLNGTTARVALVSKLEDLHHDIAALKRAMYEVSSSSEAGPETAETPPASPGWSKWTAGILSTGGSGSPSRNPSPAPTFGNVMTTPRLRKPSLNARASSSSLSSDALNASSTDPFAILGLRVSMPSHVHVNGNGNTNGVNGKKKQHPQVQVRPRTISTMYMLGLGSRSSSLGGSPAGKGTSLSSTSTPTKSKVVVPSRYEADDVQTDVEGGDTDAETDDSDIDIE